MCIINHIGLIPDGNRRWALNNSLEYSIAYHKTMVNVIQFVEYSFHKNIHSVSIYLLSTDNLKRKREDLDAVLDAITSFANEIYSVCERHQCKVIHAGIPSILPGRTEKAVANICSSTEMHTSKRLYLLIGYNPMDEINHSTQEIYPNKISLSDLWVPERVDCIIRSAGGPAMLSNFLPLQSGYAKVYICEKYFNDLTVDDYDQILSQASSIKMPYGR